MHKKPIALGKFKVLADINASDFDLRFKPYKVITFRS